MNEWCFNIYVRFKFIYIKSTKMRRILLVLDLDLVCTQFVSDQNCFSPWFSKEALVNPRIFLSLRMTSCNCANLSWRLCPPECYSSLLGGSNFLVWYPIIPPVVEHQTPLLHSTCPESSPAKSSTAHPHFPRYSMPFSAKPMDVRTKFQGRTACLFSQLKALLDCSWIPCLKQCDRAGLSVTKRTD